MNKTLKQSLKQHEVHKAAFGLVEANHEEAIQRFGWQITHFDLMAVAWRELDDRVIVSVVSCDDGIAHYQCMLEVYSSSSQTSLLPDEQTAYVGFEPLTIAVSA